MNNINGQHQGIVSRDNTKQLGQYTILMDNVNGHQETTPKDEGNGQMKGQHQERLGETMETGKSNEAGKIKR